MNDEIIDINYFYLFKHIFNSFIYKILLLNYNLIIIINNNIILKFL